jgi:hypothetical protein
MFPCPSCLCWLENRISVCPSAVSGTSARPLPGHFWQGLWPFNTSGWGPFGDLPPPGLGICQARKR